MTRNPLFLIALIFIGMLAVTQGVFIVDQTEKAIVVQLGKPVKTDIGPGLNFKLPFVQEVVFFDARILDYDAQPSEVLTKDKKNLEVDNYSKWRIVNPLLFYTTVRTFPRAQARLDDIIYSEMRVALGQYTLIEIVSGKRAEIMDRVTREANKLVKDFGIEIVDVRIKGTDLPPENERAIFGRMRAERERQAKQYRSEGQEQASKVKAATDKERSIILAEAERQGQTLSGEGDAEAIGIYAEALNQDPEFYEFQRSLEAYRNSFSNKTRVILSPENPYLKFMRE